MLCCKHPKVEDVYWPPSWLVWRYEATLKRGRSAHGAHDGVWGSGSLGVGLRVWSSRFSDLEHDILHLSTYSRLSIRF